MFEFPNDHFWSCMWEYFLPQQRRWRKKNIYLVSNFFFCISFISFITFILFAIFIMKTEYCCIYRIVNISKYIRVRVSVCAMLPAWILVYMNININILFQLGSFVSAVSSNDDQVNCPLYPKWQIFFFYKFFSSGHHK